MNKMQPTPGEQLESRVVASLTLILQKYESIDCLTDMMLTQEASIDALDENMIRLKSEREEIEKLQLENLPLNQQYRSSRPHASETVNQLTNRIAGLIQGLLLKIGNLERKTKSSCEQLMPQLHDGVRAIQMKNAYEKYT
jgi:hypothetical protein